MEDFLVIVVIAVIVALVLFRRGHRVTIKNNHADGRVRLGHVRRTPQERYQRSRHIGRRGDFPEALPPLSPARKAKLIRMAARAHAEEASGYTPKPEHKRAIAILRTYGIEDDGE